MSDRESLVGMRGLRGYLGKTPDDPIHARREGGREGGRETTTR